MSADPRPAATVVPLRDGPAGLEVLLVQRSRTMGFFPRAWVFPGGRVDAADHALAPSDPPPLRGSPWLAHATAALREAREEVGLDLSGPAGRAFERLELWARWVTPANEPKRFDTLFLLADANGAPEPRVDGAEIVLARWVAPSEVCSTWGGADRTLAPPTFRTVDELRAYSTVAQARAAAQLRSLEPIQPVLLRSDDGRVTLRALGDGTVVVYDGERWWTRAAS